MREKDILNSLDRTLKGAEINIMENIMSSQIVKMEAHDYISKQEKTSGTKKFARLISLASAILLFISMWNLGLKMPDTYVYMDINPSITLVTNKMDKVIDLIYYDEIDKRITEDIDYKNENVNLVAERIINKLYEYNYIGKDNYLLLSVYNKDTDKKLKKQDQLKDHLRTFMVRENFESSIFTQDLSLSQELEDDASKFGISLSKMNFIKSMIKQKPDLKVENLSDLTIKELLIVSKGLGLDLYQIFDYEDDIKLPGLEDAPYIKDLQAIEEIHDKEEIYVKEEIEDKKEISVEAYAPKETNMPISLGKAIEIALGVSGGGRVIEIELEIKNNKAEYELEIINGNKKYEVELNAFTGNIIDTEIKDAKEDEKLKGEVDIKGIISVNKAEEIAISALGGGTIRETNLEIEPGKAEYEVELMKDGKKYEVKIDAYTGKVLEIDLD